MGLNENIKACAENQLRRKKPIFKIRNYETALEVLQELWNNHPAFSNEIQTIGEIIKQDLAILKK